MGQRALVGLLTVAGAAAGVMRWWRTSGRVRLLPLPVKRRARGATGSRR